MTEKVKVTKQCQCGNEFMTLGGEVQCWDCVMQSSRDAEDFEQTKKVLGSE